MMIFTSRKCEDCEKLKSEKEWLDESLRRAQVTIVALESQIEAYDKEARAITLASEELARAKKDAEYYEKQCTISDARLHSFASGVSSVIEALKAGKNI